LSAFASSERDTASGTPVDPERTVTPRQLELLALYASGYGYEHIARVKFLSPYTVKYHMSRAVSRSGARNLTHLCAALAEAGMIRRNAENIYEPVQDLRIAGE
jgi:DNA-binding NarL/FixJ family response regulator